MGYQEIRGNIFASKCETIVNTVNCVGVMGKGVALEFKRRFPNMFEEYRKICATKALRPGQILPYRKERPWVLNFAVKNDWRHPSRMEWVESCLQKFVQSYARLGIKSVAMPWIGAMNGKLPWEDVHALMRSYLRDLDDLEVEVIEFDPQASDPLFETLLSLANTMTPIEFAREAELAESAASLIFRAVRVNGASSLCTVASLDGLGAKSIERLYAFLHPRQRTGTRTSQPQLI